MSEELVNASVVDVPVADVPPVVVQVDDKPLTGIKLYNSFKKTLPKGLEKNIVALRWLEYKTMLGLPIVEKVVKVKKEKIEKVKVVKVKKEKIKKVVDNENMIGDFNLGLPQMVECSA